jgi:hypothetical protein
MDNFSDYFFVLCILACAVLFGILFTDTQAKYYEYRVETEAQLSEKDVRIEQLEKEIRLLKTDLNLKENGFSEK